jgi:hypothetical protein
MSRKGRRARSKNSQAQASAAAVALDESPRTLPCAIVPADATIASAEISSPGAPDARAGNSESERGPHAATDPQELGVTSSVTSVTSATSSVASVTSITSGVRVVPLAVAPLPAESIPEPAIESVTLSGPRARDPGRLDATEAPEHGVRDLDARFFDEPSSEDWLTHELELRDPRFVRKMTANVARRRAHLVRYVVGVVGVAAALGLAALIRLAVPSSEDDSRPRAASPMAMPTGEAVQLAPSAADPAEPGNKATGVDGGG